MEFGARGGEGMGQDGYEEYGAARVDQLLQFDSLTEHYVLLGVIWQCSLTYPINHLINHSINRHFAALIRYLDKSLYISSRPHAILLHSSFLVSRKF